jgi:WD40 repeat protein
MRFSLRASPSHFFHALLLALLLALLWVAPAHAQETKLAAADGDAGDAFGNSIALSAEGRYALVGAPDDSIDGNKLQGSAYVFERQSNGNYTQASKLIVSDGKARDEFGTDVAISAGGKYAVSGTAPVYPGRDSAYVFARNPEGSYRQQAVLTPSETGRYFGSPVAMSPDGSRVAVAGSIEEQGSEDVRQGVFVFVRRADGSYTQDAVLTAPDSVSGLGRSIAFSPRGQYIAIGSSGSGGVFVFSQSAADRSASTENGYTRVARLSVADPVEGNPITGCLEQYYGFGVSISISSDGKRVLVGAKSGILATTPGRAYVFARNQDGRYTQKVEINGGCGSALGRSVSLSADGQSALIGGNYSTDRPTEVYVFSETDTSYTKKAVLTPPNGEPDSYGSPVVLSADGQYAAVGAPFEDVDTNRIQGTAYVYGPASLPVEWAAPPTATVAGRDVILSWRTLSEANNNGFRVQHRRRDAAGANWTSGALVAGAGHAASEQRYRHRVTGLAPGRYAFRVEQIDTDGGASHSSVVEAEVGAGADFALEALGPNPFRRETVLALAAPEDAESEATLYNTLGQKVRRLDVQADGRIAVRAEGLSSGLYVVRVTTAAGARTATQTITLVR